MTTSRPVRLAATVALGAAAAQALPMIAGSRPVRAALWPEFSGRAAGVRAPRSGHVALTFDDGPDPASTPRFYRPPYGVTTAMTLAASKRLGMRPVLWTAWGRDWTAKATPDSVFRTVVGTLRGGGTILLHDSDCTSAPEAWRSALGALPRLLEYCASKGWPVGPLREHGLRVAGL